MNLSILIILPDIRSAQNVGAILRTADATNATVWTTGITPHPVQSDDPRPPHVAAHAHKLIAKTALGAELTVPHRHFSSLSEAIITARAHGYLIAALEQAATSTSLLDYQSTSPIALIAGPEVTGLAPADLAQTDLILELPMLGRKESLNVAVATGIALYHLRFTALAVT